MGGGRLFDMGASTVKYGTYSMKVIHLHYYHYPGSQSQSVGSWGSDLCLMVCIYCLVSFNTLLQCYWVQCWCFASPAWRLKHQRYSYQTLCNHIKVSFVGCCHLVAVNGNAKQVFIGTNIVAAPPVKYITTWNWTITGKMFPSTFRKGAVKVRIRLGYDTWRKGKGIPMDSDLHIMQSIVRIYVCEVNY